MSKNPDVFVIFLVKLNVFINASFYWKEMIKY